MSPLDGLDEVDTPGSRSVYTTSPVESRTHRSTSGAWSRYRNSPATTGDE